MAHPRCTAKVKVYSHLNTSSTARFALHSALISVIMKSLGALHRPGNFVRCCANHENLLPLIRKNGFLLVSRLQDRGRLEHELQVCSRIQSRRHVCGASTTRSSETQTPPELGIMSWTDSPEQSQVAFLLCSQALVTIDFIFL